jgi:hypothetical protein
MLLLLGAAILLRVLGWCRTRGIRADLGSSRVARECAGYFCSASASLAQSRLANGVITSE